ncbi:MAG: hypothetical protein ACI8WT_004949 [Clostridium sp.]|jgi:hypothetical protein
MNEEIWKNISKSTLKFELLKKSIDYNQLSKKLLEIGIVESPSNINSKINRGTFSFIFFMQCMQAINTKNIIFEIKETTNE